VVFEHLKKKIILAFEQVLFSLFVGAFMGGERAHLSNTVERDIKHYIQHSFIYLSAFGD
jgi:hypothetical protein